ncbi:MAG: Vacuolar protein sorting-associated protein 33B, partial [Paramarteilia canceri]
PSFWSYSKDSTSIGHLFIVDRHFDTLSLFLTSHIFESSIKDYFGLDFSQTFLPLVNQETKERKMLSTTLNRLNVATFDALKMPINEVHSQLLDEVSFN